MPHIVAVVNSNEDVVDMLRTMLEHDGHSTVSAHVPDFKRGRENFVQFLETHKPEVIVYDIAPPYRDNWNFLKLVLASSAAQNRTFVLTTANEALLREIAGQDIELFEIAEKPANLEAIRDAVRRALGN